MAAAPPRSIMKNKMTHESSNQILLMKISFSHRSTKMTVKITINPKAPRTIRKILIAVEEASPAMSSTILKFQAAALAIMALETTNTTKTR